jgi:4-hydroxy-tetrahydrodipicolinate reductase
VVVGAAGRMGRAVIEAMRGQPDLRLKACVDVSENRAPADGVWSSDLEAVTARGDVVVEFSTPAGCRAAARTCAARGASLVSGTTGLTSEDEAELHAAAKQVAVVRASNFSLGLAVLRHALRTTLPALAGWDVEIVERHHRLKTDSPSGTALTLARDAAAARGLAADAALRFGRSGRAGPRSAGEIGVHAVRGGTWVGDHTVLFAGDGEWIEMRHVAQDRGAFAQGALAAARFTIAVGRAGIYNIEDVLNLETR